MQTRVNFPLDNGYFRRECPLCMREFKILLTDDEIRAGSEEDELEPAPSDEPVDGVEPDGGDDGMRFCPYCGQTAGEDSWWTQEQLGHMRAIVENQAARILNREWVRPLQRMSGKHLKVTAHEVAESSTWMTPEDSTGSDMRIVDLPCCGRKVKVAENHEGVVYCFFCGFPHPDERRPG